MHCWKHQVQLDNEKAIMRDSDAICMPKSGTVTFRKEPSLLQTLLSPVSEFVKCLLLMHSSPYIQYSGAPSKWPFYLSLLSRYFTAISEVPVLGECESVRFRLISLLVSEYCNILSFTNPVNQSLINRKVSKHEPGTVRHLPMGREGEDCSLPGAGGIEGSR